MKLGRFERDAIADVIGIVNKVRDKLREKGIAFDTSGIMDACCATDGSPRIKVVCVSPGLHDTVEEMKENPREVVVMVRVDEGTSVALDAWVETGAVQSRSEAAALFIREGLKVRADELERLAEALRAVNEAKSRLRDQAKEVFGGEKGSG